MWGPTLQDWCPSKKKETWRVCPPRKGQLGTQSRQQSASPGDGPQEKPTCVTLIADLQPPEPQDNECLLYKPPDCSTLFQLPESPTPLSTAVWLGRYHILECQVSIFGKGVTHTAPHGRHVFTSQSPLRGQRSSELSFSFPSHRSETHNVEHTPNQSLGVRARPGWAS